MNIDHDKVAKAQKILGTTTATATVHQALDEVIRRFHLARLAEWEFPPGAWEEIRELRRPRVQTREWAPGHLDDDDPAADAS